MHNKSGSLPELTSNVVPLSSADRYRSQTSLLDRGGSNNTSDVVLMTLVLVSRLSFNVLVSGCKVLVLVSSWTLQALFLGLRSLEPCTKPQFFQKGVIFLEKPHFQGVLWVHFRRYSLFSIICSS